ncbi:MAG: polysaccharide biosynthesis/export family protein [Rickettsiales bacterium]
MFTPLRSFTLLLACVAIAGCASQKNNTTTKPASVTETVAASPARNATTAINDAAYSLRAGDTLRISVWKEEQLDREVLILPDGTVDFPLIGSFMAAGNTPSQVKDAITQKLQPFVPSAAVTVIVKQTGGNSVSIIGQVTRPGDIVMARRMTVMQALSQAGGLTPYADDDDIVILRKINGKEMSIPFDYSDVAEGRHLDANIILKPGDVVVVPTASLF